MTISELIIAEYKARANGDTQTADNLQKLRWQQAMGMIVNNENTKKAASNR